MLIHLHCGHHYIDVYLLVLGLQSKIWGPSIREGGSGPANPLNNFWYVLNWLLILCLFCSALLSTDSWMESVIKKQLEKKGKTNMELIATTMDPFLEVTHYFSQPWLRWEDCPNPIPWWGVGFLLSPHIQGFNLLLVSTWRPGSSDDGLWLLLGYPSNGMHSWEVVFSFSPY